MRRRIGITLLGGALALLALSGCGREPPAAPQPAPKVSAEEQSLGRRVQAVGERAQDAVNDGEKRNRAAVDSAE